MWEITNRFTCNAECLQKYRLSKWSASQGQQMRKYYITSWLRRSYNIKGLNRKEESQRKKIMVRSQKQNCSSGHCFKWRYAPLGERSGDLGQWETQPPSKWETSLMDRMSRELGRIPNTYLFLPTLSNQQLLPHAPHLATLYLIPQ